MLGLGPWGPCQLFKPSAQDAADWRVRCLLLHLYTILPNPDPRPPAGLPESALELAAQAARAEGHEDATPEAGPWSFGLDFPSYFPVMTHAKNRCACLSWALVSQ